MVDYDRIWWSTKEYVNAKEYDEICKVNNGKCYYGLWMMSDELCKPQI